MPRDIMQDIRPKKRLREILPKGDVGQSTPKESPSFIPPPPEKPMLKEKNYFNNPIKLAVWAVAIIIVLFLAFFISSKLASVTVLITPNQGKISVSGTYTAYRDALPGELGFKTLSIDSTESKVVSATGSETVNEKASGQIVVYNDFDSNSQRLIPETRFETPDGKIYRIKDAITVPGKKKSGDKTVPGQLEVTVYADSSGDDFNIGLTDFTIPGFKGDPRFDSFYARSKTTMSGGFSGEIKKVDAVLEEDTRSELQTSLSQKLLDEVRGQVNEGFVMYSDAVFVSFSKLPVTPVSGDSDKAEITEKATASFVVFDEKELSKYLAENSSVDLDGDDEVVIDGLEGFNFSLINKSDINIQTADSFTFSIDGDSLIVWWFDTEKITEELAGSSKGSYQDILAKYSAIERAEVSFSPPWVRSFPGNAEKIQIEQVLEK